MESRKYASNGIRGQFSEILIIFIENRWINFWKNPRKIFRKRLNSLEIYPTIYSTILDAIHGGFSKGVNGESFWEICRRIFRGIPREISRIAEGIPKEVPEEFLKEFLADFFKESKRLFWRVCEKFSNNKLRDF